MQAGDIIMTLKGDCVLVHRTNKMLLLFTVDDVLKCDLDEQLHNPCVVDVFQTFKDIVGQYS